MARRCTRLVLVTLALGGCCLGGDDYLTLGLGPGTSRSVPPWGGTATFAVRDRPMLEADWLPEHPVAGAVFEAFADDGATPVALACSARRIDNASRNGCGFSDQVTCDLAALPPGRYAIVHRRARGNGDPLNCAGACPWTTFQGEPALRFTLALTP
ncbi:MAG: hypothetical protein JWM10_4111 [Myxococcaceae bacterium]|nr:hypothetical protein [Myxococcaceae bacterium]